MSNVSIHEICQLVANAYRVETSAILKQPHGMVISPAMREARAVILLLVGKHTLWTGRQTLEGMGLAYNGDLLRRMTEEGERFTALMDKDTGKQALFERVEQGIDRIHEGRDMARQSVRAVSRKRLPARPRVRPLKSVKEQDLTAEWWASNDLRFRTAILDAAE